MGSDLVGCFSWELKLKSSRNCMAGFPTDKRWDVGCVTQNGEGAGRGPPISVGKMIRPLQRRKRERAINLESDLLSNVT